jgi:hypothetical protein
MYEVIRKVPNTYGKQSASVSHTAIHFLFPHKNVPFYTAEH